MKNLKLSALLCGGEMGNCMPHTPRARDASALDSGASRSLRRDDGPLGALSPRRRHGFKQGLDDWVKRPTDDTQHRKTAAECMEKAASNGARELTLSRLGLTRLTSQIGVLKRLQALDLSHNNLNKLPASLGELENLTDLVVDFNKLESLPEELKYLSQLNRLSAESNQLSQVPESMALLTQLRHVNLRSNQIWNLPLEWIDLLKRLRRLDLSDNRLKGLPVPPGEDKAFARADVRAKPLELNLSNNEISILPKSYGTFRYHNVYNDHLLKNAACTIVVHTENTKIREGLVGKGRLAEGRGVVIDTISISTHEGARLDSDSASLNSFGSHVRRHGEPGQTSGIVRPPQAAPEPDWFGDQPEWTKARAAEDLDDEAGMYADDGAPPPFAANVHSMPPQANARMPSFGHAAAPPPPNEAPDLTSELAAELQRLPEPVRSVIVSELARVPPAVLEAELARIQTVGRRASAAVMPPAGVAAVGAASMAPQFAAPPFGTQAAPPFTAAVPPQFAAQAVPPFPPQVQPQATTQAAPPFTAPVPPQFATQTVPSFPPQTQPPATAQTVPPFTAPAATPVAQQPPAHPPGAGMQTPWASADQLWPHNAPPPWAGAGTSRFGMSQGDADRWAPPRWVTPNGPEETPAHGEVQESSTKVWTVPPMADIAMQPDALDLLEDMMRFFQ